MENKKPVWMCNLEWREYFTNPGWEFVHNGQASPYRFEFPPDGVRFFTRKYFNRRTKVDVTFVYDRRNRRGDILRFEYHDGERSQSSFKLSQSGKSRRDIFTVEAK